MADPSGSGTTVTLVVPARPGTPTAPVPSTRPLPHHHLPFTGFDVASALLVAVLLLALGAVLLLGAHPWRRSARPSRSTSRTSPATPLRRNA